MMHHVLAAWQNIGIGAGLVFGILVVMQKAFDRCATLPDTGPRDYRLPMDRRRDLSAPKDLTDYDAIAREQLRRLHDRRRRLNVDNGQRRRGTDRP